MSIYICEKCGAIENTATGGYWENHIEHEPKKCSQCNFEKWHGKFLKKHWTNYGVEKLLELEKRKDGSMINVTNFLKSIGEI